MNIKSRVWVSEITIVFGALLMSAVIWAVAIERVGYHRTERENAAREENANLLLVLEEHTRALLSQVDQSLAFVRLQVGQERAGGFLRRMLADATINRSLFRALYVVDAQGHVLETSAPLPSGSAIDGRELGELAAAAGDQLHIGTPWLDADGVWRLNVARRLDGADGRFEGAVVAVIDPIKFAAFYHETSLKQRDLIVVVRDDGIALVRRSGDRLSAGYDMREKALMRLVRKSPSGTHMSRGRHDGMPRYMNYKRMPDFPLILEIGSSQQRVLRPYFSESRQLFAIAFAATVTLLLLAALLLRSLRQQRTALRDVMRSEGRLRATFDQAFVGMALISPEGQTLQVNATLCDMLGYDEGELLARPLDSFVAPEDRVDGGLLADEAPAERRMVRRDGRMSWARVATTVVSDAEGKTQCYVTVVHDITDFKRVDGMKSEFVSMVSHELRTPLTSIRGSLGLVAGGVAGALAPSAKSLIDIANSNCERLIRLINDILDTEKIESGKMSFDLREVELAPLVERAIAANQGFAVQKQVRLELSAVQEGIAVRVDADRLEQVITNLLSNAVKFSPAGAAVEVRVTCPDGRAHVEVRDHGPGIPEEFRNRIFQKFSQADSSDARQKGGTGLGLNISKAIVERLGGTIGFTTAAGEGTTFHFELPALPRPQARTTPATRPCVLVCEDDPDIARLIGMMLDTAGYDTDVAHTAAAARARLKCNRYAAMTVDLMLPDEHGISLVRALRRDTRTQSLPVIVVSAVAREGQVRLNSEALSIADWLEKPIDQVRLIQAVREGIAGDTSARPRILHVEDEPDIQSIAQAVVDDFADFEFAGTIAEARACLRHWKFDLVLLDLRLPDGSGWDLMPQIQMLEPMPPVVVFSVDDVDVIPHAGVTRVLVKTETSNDVLLATIRGVLERRKLLEAA